MILNDITIGAHELWQSLIAIMPILGLILALVFVIILTLWIHRKIVISNHFYDNIDPDASSEIALLRKQNDDKDKELSAKNKRIEHLESCIQRIIEIGIKS